MTGIPFAFQLPASVGEPPTAESSRASASAPQVSVKVALTLPLMENRVWTHNAPPVARRWRLVVTAPTRGTDFSVEFPVEVDDR